MDTLDKVDSRTDVAAPTPADAPLLRVSPDYSTRRGSKGRRRPAPPRPPVRPIL